MRKNLSIVVTGGGGFLGREFCQQASKEGYPLRVLGSRSSIKENLLPQSVSKTNSYFHGDLLGEEQKITPLLSSLFEGLGENDVLVHLAGRVSRSYHASRSMMELHIEGTRRVFRLAVQQKIKKIILLSTSGVVGISSEEKKIADDDTPYALEQALAWPYYASKIFQEKLAIRLANEHRLKLLILRPSLLLGPGDVGLSSTGDVKNFIRGQIYAIPQGGLSFLDVRDVAQAILLGITDGFSKITPGEHRSYLLGAENMKFSVFLQKLSQLSGIKMPLLAPSRRKQLIGAQLLQLRKDKVGSDTNLNYAEIAMANHFWYIQSDRAKKELGWAPRPIEITLRDTIDFICSDEKAKAI